MCFRAKSLERSQTAFSVLRFAFCIQVVDIITLFLQRGKTMAGLSEFPKRLRASTQKPDVVYVRDDEHYAVHGQPAKGRGVVMAEGESGIAVFEGQPKSLSKNMTAVYRNDAALAVPTGRVFVRFAEGVEAGDRLKTIEQAGYCIEQQLSYAPNAAWLSNPDGDIACALSHIEQLEQLPDVENVEPQLLTPRALKF
jgi:hypothetical protein